MRKKKQDTQDRVLVVDDVEENRDMLSRRLARRGYEVETAAGGRAALEQIAKVEFDAVLLDIMMPDMDGFETLDAIRKKHSREQLPVLMVTAKDESDDIVRALDLGANDYVTKPIDLAVCLARLRTHVNMKHASQALADANRRMVCDLQAAARVQQALLPTNLPNFPGVDFAWVFEPCDELGGDILNVFALDDRTVGFYLLDVSGHGVEAALLSVTLSRLLMPLADRTTILGRPGALTRSDSGLGTEPTSVAHSTSSVRTLDHPMPAYPYAITPPNVVARRLNRQFQMDEDTRQYFTFFYGMIDLPLRQLRYVTAGHPGPVCLRAGSSEPEILKKPSPPIGWFEDMEYDLHVLDLEPGDQFLVWSDRVIEALDASQNQFGAGRLPQLLADYQHVPIDQCVQRITDEVKAWTRGPMADDLSIVGMHVE